MPIFIALMIGGLAGLALMALPVFGRHGHSAAAPHGLSGHSTAHLTAAGGGLRTAHGTGHGIKGAGRQQSEGATGLLRLIPSPRAIFSLMAIFGAFGYGLVAAGLVAPVPAALLALLPALLVERFAVTPVWNLLFRFQGTPSAPLGNLLLTEAKAVTPFRNGRGLVSVVRDGRVVQLRAELLADQHAMPIRVGDPLVIEDVDETAERLTVSVR